MRVFSTNISGGYSHSQLPYWAFAWGGGLAIARYLEEHHEVVAGRRVFDLGSGSGLCAIAVSRALSSSIGSDSLNRLSSAMNRE